MSDRNLPIVIGKRIQAARSRLGWTQSDLARALGKHRQHLNPLELGKQLPRVDVLMELADVLGVTTDYLLGRSPDEEPEQPTLKRKGQRSRVSA